MRVGEFAGLIKSFGVGRIAAIFGATVGVALALALIAARVSAPDLSVLYADLPYADADAVTRQLDAEGVAYELRERGGAMTVLAPRDAIAALKLRLAGDGLVLGGGVGYEIFDNNDAFGATTFQQNVNRLRALEGELARTIASLSGVRSARVHLVLPERALFQREQTPPSASIVLDAPGGLAPQAVRAIVNLVASAAPALKPSHVTVLGADGSLLASGGEDEIDAMARGMGEDLATAAGERLRKTVEAILSPVVGAENIRVQASAEIDLARVTESAEIIDPDSQTILSSTIVEEAANETEPGFSRAVTVANALPEADAPADSDAATSANRRTEETTNYEFSRRVRNETREIGGLKRLSIAVAVNARADGAVRDEAEIERLRALVAAAVGYNPARGDRIDVVEAAFTADAAPTAAAPPVAAAGTTARAAPSTDDWFRVAELAALALVALALVYFVARPLIANAVSPDAGKKAAPNAAALPPSEPPRLSDSIENEAPRIDLARLEGAVKTSSMKQAAEVVRTHTDESASILKGWIREAS